MRLAAAVLAAALGLGGCAALEAPQSRALLQSVPSGLPLRAERSDIPFFPQTPYHCGPAALAMALGDVGIAADPAQLAATVFLPSRQGSLQTEMIAGARRAGALAYRLPAELRALLGAVAAGQAVVVLQNLGLSLAPRWHYAVVIGYDLGQGEILLHSGATRRERMALATFEHTWARGGRWAVVLQPPGRLPDGVEETRAVDAAIGFERVAPPAAAAAAYAELAARWPDNLLAGMGLGNALLATGDADAAVAAFERTAARHRHAAVWNNLAQAQLARGALDAAQVAAERALALAQGDQLRWAGAARSTLEAVRDARRAGPR